MAVGCDVVCGGGVSVQSVHVVCLICRSFLKEKFLLLFFFSNFFLNLSLQIMMSTHQDCGSDMRILFMDCDSEGSEWTNQEEMRTTGESVCECKDKTDSAL